MQFSDTYLRAFKDQFNINYEILRFDSKIIGAYFGSGAPAVPTMFVIDRERKIRDKLVGFQPGAVEKSISGIIE